MAEKMEWCPSCKDHFYSDDSLQEHFKQKHSVVEHPQHYNRHASGIECIEIVRHMEFNTGNAIKYIWRADHKNGVEDLEKAAWYIADEIAKRKRVQDEARKDSEGIPSERERRAEAKLRRLRESASE